MYNSIGTVRVIPNTLQPDMKWTATRIQLNRMCCDLPNQIRLQIKS